jgi:hypothetical protein
LFNFQRKIGGKFSQRTVDLADLRHRWIHPKAQGQYAQDAYDNNRVYNKLFQEF